MQCYIVKNVEHQNHQTSVSGCVQDSPSLQSKAKKHQKTVPNNSREIKIIQPGWQKGPHHLVPCFFKASHCPPHKVVFAGMLGPDWLMHTYVPFLLQEQDGSTDKTLAEAKAPPKCKAKAKAKGAPKAKAKGAPKAKAKGAPKAKAKAKGSPKKRQWLSRKMMLPNRKRWHRKQRQWLRPKLMFPKSQRGQQRQWQRRSHWWQRQQQSAKWSPVRRQILWNKVCLFAYFCRPSLKFVFDFKRLANQGWWLLTSDQKSCLQPCLSTSP